MQLWKWLGLAAISLFAPHAGAQSRAAFPPESPTAATPPTAESPATAPEPVVHDVASQQQPQQPGPQATPRVLPPPPVSELPEAERWYGGYTLMSDGLSLAALFLGGVTEPNGEPFVLIAASGYLLGAPIVHLAYGNPGRAAASFGLRVGLPIAFFGVGTVIEDCHGHESCGYGSLLVGVPLGMVTAIALDAAVLARDTVKLQIVPTAAVGPNGASIGLGGTF